MPLDEGQRKAVLEMLRDGRSIKYAASQLLVHPNVIHEAKEFDASFRTACTLARAEGAHAMVDALRELDEDVTIPVDRARLMSDNRKWAASRLNPKVYGDRVDVNMNQTIDIGANLAEARARSRITATHVQPAIAPPVLDAVFTAIPDLRTTDTQSAIAPPSVEPSIFD